jgi:hypothetical protein
MKTTKKVPHAPAPEAIINDAPRTFTDADFPIGSVAHQGDLILVRIEMLPKSARPRAARQLAEGSTQGSRHILHTGRAFDCNLAEVARAIATVCSGNTPKTSYIGPVFCCTQGGRADLLHPEHGNHHYRGDMTIAVVYQRNLDAEDREQRTRD